MNWIDLISALLGLTCVFLAGRGSKYNFWVGYLYTAALFFLFLEKNLLASLMLQPISLGINIMGHYRWTHPKDGEQSSEKKGELKVSMLTWPERGLALASLVVAAGVWGWLINRLFPADPVPYLDCCVTVLILIAQLLSALKKWDCWIVWIVVNCTQLALHLSVGNWFMAAVSVLYLVNGIISLINWNKLYRRKA